MKARKLKIGNLALVNGKISEVTASNIYEKQLDELSGDSTIKVEPIPLTEEWLGRIKNWQSKFEITFCWDHGNTAYDGIYITLNGERIKQIHYVHEAQNWHYLTTDKELEIKQ